nr:MAG TPA: hypothetical protein [Bacteriophage sp.]
MYQIQSCRRCNPQDVYHMTISQNLMTISQNHMI